MDDGLIEGVGAMTRFVNLLVADPETSRVPFMIDSSKVDTPMNSQTSNSFPFLHPYISVEISSQELTVVPVAHFLA